jgi:hypothetical protein
MNALPHLLLITALSIPTTTLVLRSGARIDVDGAVRQENGWILFRAGGALYSVRVDEVDLDGTRAAGSEITVSADRAGKLKGTPEERQRILRDLEQNHVGRPATQTALDVPPGPTPVERREATQEEWSWKRQARAHEEEIRRAVEQRELLVNRAEQIRAHIAGLLSLGYKPSQFSYDTTLLAYTTEQIPQAELEVERAQRAYVQFRDDARRQGVTPGWLR